MEREELVQRLHELVGELMKAEAAAGRLGEAAVAEHLEAARRAVVSAARLIEPSY